VPQRRECLFCNRPADTLEHVWPEWVVNNLLGQRKPIKAVVGKTHFEIPGHSARLKARRVCSVCNSGWMSDLENRNRKIIGPLMHDVGFMMDSSQQSAVAGWALKTTIVAESLRKDSQCFYAKAERDQLRLTLAIPALTTVWLARYSGENDLALYGTYLWEGGKPDDPRAIPGMASTIFVGCLAIQILTLRRPRQNGGRTIRVPPSPGPWLSLVTKIWPATRTVTWPPKLSFADRRPFPWPALVKRWSIGEVIE